MKAKTYLEAMEKIWAKYTDPFWTRNSKEIYKSQRQYNKFRGRLLQKISELEQVQKDYTDLINRLPNEIQELAVIDCFGHEPKWDRDHDRV